MSVLSPWELSEAAKVPWWRSFIAMLSSSCSDLFLSCTKDRRLSSSGRFPEYEE
jgi:hypothetical protein